MEREDLLRRINQAADEQWQKLDLSGQGITEIPAEIFKLTNLTYLDLSDNQITEIPVAIEKSTNLTKLDLSGNQITEIPVAIEKLTNLTNLLLSRNQITEIPAEIEKLTNLTYLDLSGNQITEIPVAIEKLTNLTILILNYNQITEIPVAIEKLTKLTHLVLSDNQITEIPVAIEKLTNLTYLLLSRNQITEIPAEIEKLTNLIDLDLGNNQITKIPVAIEKLTKLTYLSLRYNQITEIPAEIFKLTKLTDFDLRYNQITEIPVAIEKLANLTSLNISDNQITEIPVAIEKLTKLIYLFLGDNQITEIPVAIEKLINLIHLDLGNNQIIEIPVAIEKLTNLTHIDLSNNQIAAIPQWFQSFENLRKLDLCGNPMPIPREILSGEEYWKIGDLQAILSFYFQIQDPNATEPLYEAKFIIVGEGAAGKTTLTKKLQDADYKLDPQEEKTHGINIIHWEFTQPNGKPFRVNIWDFGGQEILHATHQFFLTERSLYTLLVDERRENPNLYYWLNIVRLLSDNSPVFIIKNEKQECQCQFDEGQLRGEFDNLQNSVRTNFATNRGLDDIKQAIATHIAALPHIHIPIPKTWVRIRAVLENYSQQQDYISVEEYYTLCKTNGLKDKKEMLNISKYLHDLGICLHFQTDPVLKHRVILNPTWATNAVYRITENKSIQAKNGCFTTTDLATIWGDAQYAQMHDELLQLMTIKNFGICYPIRNLPNTYIAPSLLSLDKPIYTWNETENLILSYEYEFMPRGILTRFIVEMHNLIESCPAPAPATSQLVWKNGVILTDSRARAEIIEFDDKRAIRIRVVGFQKKALLDCIRHEFHKIHASYERLQYQELIPCNCAICKNTQTPYTYTLQSLLKRLENRKFTVECDESYESVNVRRLIYEVIEPMRDEKDLMQEIGDDSVVYGNVPFNLKVGNRSVVVGSTDANGNTILDRSMAVGYGAQAGENGISIGAFAGSGNLSNTPTINQIYHIHNVEKMTGNTTPNIGGDYVRGDKVMGDKVMGDKIGTQINNSQNLAEAALEIKALLDNLDETYNANSETGQAKIAKDAIEQIKQNPTLMGRITNALTEGSYTALEEAVNHPTIKVVMAAVKGFVEVK
jgi:Leucine-rich repeat (LRR) protein/GTPase SAR1 family protein